jgi:hypothetical protein
LILPELANLAFGFADRGGSGKSFADGFAAGFVGEAEGRAMPRISRTSAVAGGLAATAHDAGDGTGTKVLESGQLGKQMGAFEFEVGDEFRHGRSPCSERLYYVQNYATKKKSR